MKSVNNLFFGTTLVAFVFIFALTSASAGVPATPENFSLQVSMDTPQGSQVEWDAVDGADSYNVYFREFDFETETASEWTVVGETDETSFFHETNIFNLIAYRVTAVNSDGESEPSEAISQCMTAIGPSNIEGDAVETIMGTEGSGDTGSGAVQFIDVIGSDKVSTHVSQGTVFTYDANTLGELLGPKVADGAIVYALEEGPAGMTINAYTGEVRWEADAAGTHTVVISASESGTSHKAQKSWELQSTSTTSVSDNKAFTRTSIWPAPATDVINLRFSAEQAETLLQIVSAGGTTAISRTLTTANGENLFTLDVRNLASGSWYLRLTNSAGTTTLPFSIVR